MKKKVRGALLLLLVAGVTLGAIFILLNMKGEDDTAESSQVSETSVETVAVTEKEEADIEDISISYGGETFVIKSTPLNEEDAFVIEGLEDFDLMSDNISGLARALYKMNASKTIGDTENIESYGLEGSEALTAVLNFKDGTKDELVVGTTAGSGVGRYVLHDGTVYIVNALPDMLFGGSYGLINKTAYSVEDILGTDEAGNPTALPDEMASLKLSGAKYAQPIEIAFRSEELSVFKILAPMETDGSSDRMGEIIPVLKSFTASEVAKAGYTEENLADFGLAEPYAVAEFTLNSENHVVSISEKDTEGNTYVTVDDNNVIYKAPWSAVSTWADKTLMNLRSPYILLPNIMDVSGVALTGGGVDKKLNITREKDEENSTEDNLRYILTIECDGADLSYDEVYQPFYKELISMAVLSVDEPEYYLEEPVFAFTYEYFDGGSDEISFYEIPDQDRYAAKKNGEFNGVMRKTTVDGIIAAAADMTETKEAA